MLLGDPCQLRPTGPVTMLSTQYRMHSAICQFPSKAFYHNRLKTFSKVDQEMEHFPLQPLYLYDMANSRHYIDHGGSSFNIDEVNFVIQFCKMLATDISIWRSLIFEDSEEYHENSAMNTRPIMLNDDRSIAIQQRIAVITPYQAQIRRFESQLPQDIELMTADSAQGSEKDIVIISCVRSHGTIGFLDDRSRLNVMLTRAKYGLYVVGNLTSLALQDKYWKGLIDDAHKRKILHCLGLMICLVFRNVGRDEQVLFELVI